MPHPVSLNLHQSQTQSLKQNQRLIMSPQMQQAIHLLQMPILELSLTVAEEMQQNPVLESEEEDSESQEPSLQAIERDVEEVNQNQEAPSEQEITFDDHDFKIMKQLDEEFRDHFSESGNYYSKKTAEEEKQQTFMESLIRSNETLFDHLMEQAHEVFTDQKDLEHVELIVGNLDERGFFTTSLKELALLNDADEERLEKVLHEIQTFDPYGVGAHDLQESLLIQLGCLGKRDRLAYSIVERHYDDMLHNRLPVIAKGLGCSAAEVREEVQRHVACLDLHPGTWHSQEIVQYITPDVTIKCEGEAFNLEINNDQVPSLRLNSKYMRMLEDDTLPTETKEYIRRKVTSGKWLLRNIHQRNETLYKITESLTKRQKDFFVNPNGKLVPMTMKIIAEELGLHESTIARAVSNKYVSSPRGLLPLRSFFTNAYETDRGTEVSSQTVRDILRQFIDTEDKNQPLSDDALSLMIKSRGINCARRTVAKYRQELNIGNTAQRRLHS